MVPDWADLFDNYGIKTASPTDKEKGAYIPTAAQRFAMASAGLEPSWGESKAAQTIEVLFDPAVRTMRISYYNSERSGSGRSPEPRIGRGLPRWIAAGDAIVIGNVGARIFVAKEPIPSIGQDFLTAEDGNRLTKENGDYITVPVEPDLDQLTHDLEAGKPTLVGNPAERDRRDDLLSRIDELEEELNRARPNHGGLGHNNPPAESEQNSLSPEVLAAVASSAETIRSELTKDEPDALEIARAGSALRGIAHWLAGKGDIFADEFVKAFGKSLGNGTAKAIAFAALVKLLMSIVIGVSSWLQVVTWPF